MLQTRGGKTSRNEPYQSQSEERIQGNLLGHLLERSSSSESTESLRSPPTTWDISSTKFVVYYTIKWLLFACHVKLKKLFQGYLKVYIVYIRVMSTYSLYLPQKLSTLYIMRHIFHFGKYVCSHRCGRRYHNRKHSARIPKYQLR